MGKAQELTALVPQSNAAQLSLTKLPAEILRDAQIAADALIKLVREKKLSVKIGTSEHLKCEAWQTLGIMFGVSAEITSTKYVVIGGAAGFKARAEALLIATGKTISAGEALCLNDEESWGTRPKYEYPNGNKTKVGEVPVPTHQLMAMAETRAISRALRNVLAWVVALAGYDPTPAEDMAGNERSAQAKPPIQQPQQKPNGAAGELLTFTGRVGKVLICKGRNGPFRKVIAEGTAYYLHKDGTLPIAGGEPVSAFALLDHVAPGSSCSFEYKNEVSSNRVFPTITRLLRIAEHEWAEDGQPIFGAND